MLEDEEVRIQRVLQDSRTRTQKARHKLVLWVFVAGLATGSTGAGVLSYIDRLQAERDAALRQLEAAVPTATRPVSWRTVDPQPLDLYEPLPQAF